MKDFEEFCDKCAWCDVQMVYTPELSISYPTSDLSNASTPHTGGSFTMHTETTPEHLECVCKRCGYNWAMKITKDRA